MKTQERILRSISRRTGVVMLRAEFDRFGSYSNVSKALASLVKEGRLVRAGKGVFVKTKISSLTGNVIPAGSLEIVATEALGKLGVEVWPGRLAEEYNQGKSTQIPARMVVNTGRRRISRRIEIGGCTLIYENTFNRT